MEPTVMFATYLNIPTASDYRTPRQTLGEVSHSHLLSDAGPEELM